MKRAGIRSRGKSQVFALTLVATLLFSACASAEASLPAPAVKTTSTSPEATPTETISEEVGEAGSAVVFFLKEGNIGAWEESSGETITIFDGGDAISVKLSPDRQLIAFLRRTIVSRSETDWYEQSALWVMDINGENQRELVSADQLRELLEASETDSTNMPQVEWVPGSHRLLFTGWTYFVIAEGESHAFPAGLHLVDAENSEHSALLPNENSARFAVAPNGETIAIMTTAGFGFMDIDGSNPRLDFLDYPDVGFGGSAFPSGAWTQDSSAFMLASSYVSENGEQSLAIRRVPVDGSSVEIQATLTDSHPDSVVFSPNGRHVAYVKAVNWFIADLEGEARPLALPYGAYFFWRRIHWSPAGLAYATLGPRLHQLCPDATQESETCKVLELGAAAVENGRAQAPLDIAYVEWIDDERFMFTTREPEDLYFGNLNGEISLVSTESVFFSVKSTSCINDAEFAAGGEGPTYTSVVAGDVFEINWRLRNSGSCTWDDSYRINYLGGSLENPTASISLSDEVQPSGEIEVAVQVTAPSSTGEFLAEWQLFGADGVPFGLRLPVEGEVPDYPITDLPEDRILAKIPSIMGWLDFGDGRLWALSAQDLQIWGIDPASNALTPPLKAGDLLGSIAVGFGSIWVVGGDANLTRIDPATNTISAVIPVEIQEFQALSFVETGAGSVWVSSTDGSVTRIDPESNQVVATFAVPWAAQIAATENAVWVTNWIGPFLTRIDPDSNEISAVMELECRLFGIAADETGVWATCGAEPTLFRIDPATNRVVARFAVGERPSPKDVALGANVVWVTARRGGVLMQIDQATNQVIAVYRVGQNTFDLAANGGDLWVSVQGEGAVWRIKP